MLRFRTILITLAALWLLPAPLRAQDLSRDRVQLAIDITDRRIEQAEALVAGSDNDQARVELDLANSIQVEARRAFSNSQMALALRLTGEARVHADRAIAIVKGPNPDGVQAQLERTREILERANEQVQECDDPRARAMIRAAGEMQVRAEAAAREGRFLAALQLTMAARERGLRALRLCNLEENLDDAAERALRRTDDQISRAQDVVGDGSSELARLSLRRAIELEDRAWREFREEHFGAALRLTQAARAQAHRAIRLASERP
jgi:hypothetical protein